MKIFDSMQDGVFKQGIWVTDDGKIQINSYSDAKLIDLKLIEP